MTAPLDGKSSRPGDYDAVKKSIIDLLKQPEYDDGSAGPVIVRLAWYGIPPLDPWPPMAFFFFFFAFASEATQRR